MAFEVLKDSDQTEVCDTDLAGVPNGDPEVFYTIRKLDPKTHKAIVKKHTTYEFVRGVGRVEKTDGTAATDDILDYVLVGWRGVLLHGDPAPCTREWKLGGLDLTRAAALIDLATANLVSAPERRAESFRATS